MNCLEDMIGRFYDHVRNNVPEDYMLPISGKIESSEHLHGDYDEWLPLLHVILGLFDLGTTLWFYSFLLDKMRDTRNHRHDSIKTEEEYEMHVLYLYATLFFFTLGSTINLILVLLCGTPSSLFYSQKELEEYRGGASDFDTFDNSHSVVVYGAIGPNAEVVNGTYDKTTEVKHGGYVYLKRSSHFKQKIHKRIYMQLDIDDEVDEPGTGRWTVLPADSKKQGLGFGWAGVAVDLQPEGSGAFVIESNHPYIIAHKPLKKTIQIHDAVGYKVKFDPWCSWGDSAVLAFNFEGQNEVREHYLEDGTYRSIEITSPGFTFQFDPGDNEEEDETYWGFRIEVTPIFDTDPHDIIPSIVRTSGTYWNVHDTEDWVPHPEMKVEKFIEQDSFLLRSGAVHHTSLMYEFYLICWRSMECWHLFENYKEEREGTIEWKVSDKVQAMCKGTTYYSTGYIIHIVEDKCDVNFENGSYETIDMKNLRKAERNCTDTNDISFYVFFPFHLLGIEIIFLTILFLGLILKYMRMIFIVFSDAFTIFIRAFTFIFVLVDSELCYLFYGRREFYTVMTVSSVYIEGISMMFVQVFYMICMAAFYNDNSPVAMQYISLLATFFHLAFSGIYKQIFHCERPPPARSVLFIGRESEAIEKSKEKTRSGSTHHHTFQVHPSDLYAHHRLADGEGKVEGGFDGDDGMKISRDMSSFSNFSASRQASSANWSMNSTSPPGSPRILASMSPMSVASTTCLSAMSVTTDGASSKRKPVTPSPSKKKQMARARKADNLTQLISL